MPTNHPQLVFDEDKHEYRLVFEDGRILVLPNVTSILEWHKIGPTYPAGPYRTRGRQVHLAAQYFDLGKNIQVGDKIQGYLESYKKVLKEWPFRWKHIELRKWHTALLYAGTIDRVGCLDESPTDCVADIKSGDTGDETELQTAAYAMLVDPVYFRNLDRYKIRLFKDGSAGKVSQYKDPFAFEAWTGYLNTWKWENRGKK